MMKAVKTSYLLVCNWSTVLSDERRVQSQVYTSTFQLANWKDNFHLVSITFVESINRIRLKGVWPAGKLTTNPFTRREVSREPC
jgi:hypothetical protein